MGNGYIFVCDKVVVCWCFDYGVNWCEWFQYGVVWCLLIWDVWYDCWVEYMYVLCVVVLEVGSLSDFVLLWKMMDWFGCEVFGLDVFLLLCCQCGG